MMTIFNYFKFFPGEEKFNFYLVKLPRDQWSGYPKKEVFGLA